jgi:hypothetical protein
VWHRCGSIVTFGLVSDVGYLNLGGPDVYFKFKFQSTDQ